MQNTDMTKRPFRKSSEVGTDLKSAFEFFVMPEPNSGCWLWAGPYLKRRHGYGCFTMRPAGIIQVRAHRLSWELHLGEIPPGVQVLHKCDNPACVNPDHLFLGSHLGNMADRDSKGRQNKGETHGMVKLTEESVRLIFSDPRRHTEVASEYGISFVTVSDIKRGRSWKHLGLATTA